ncbi:copper resistance CopC family protein [Curtobacterium sp. B8]|uniref:copper resistance CopC family protein n=1 Tax=Curtobacterium sp. B8 TaxID=95611 RepID=UPI0003455162|nr:copper resistance CopC family protein [Curtobacterium sp. B8]
MRSRSVLVTLLLVALATLLGAAPASAHSALVSSDPAAEGTVTAPLDRVTLTFSEAPLAGLDAGLRIEVRDGQGADVSTGDVEVSGTAMSKAVDLGSGRYRVLWRYVSPDGHPITGEYGFTASLPTRTPSPTASSTTPVTPSAAASSGASAAAATATAAPAGATTHAGHSSGLVWVIGGLAVAVAIVAAVTAVLRRRGGRGRPRGAASVDDAGR